MEEQDAIQFNQQCSELDPQVLIDSVKPPVPISVLFSKRSRLSDEGFGELATMLCQLSHLDLSNTKISNRSILMLANSRSLESLGVPCTLDTSEITRLFQNPKLQSIKMPISSDARKVALPGLSDQFKAVLTVHRQE